jgi:transcriptional regulator with GAF, ATPase, and Fis domain
LTHNIDELLATLAPAKDEVDFHSAVDALQQLSILFASAVEALKFCNLPDSNAEVDFYAEVRRFEIGLIVKALKRVDGSQLKAARLLNMKTTTLNSKVKLYGIDLLRPAVPLSRRGLLKQRKS